MLTSIAAAKANDATMALPQSPQGDSMPYGYFVAALAVFQPGVAALPGVL